MTDHCHIFDKDGHCSTCYEREDAAIVKLEFLHDQTMKAIDIAQRTIRQLVEDDAADRLQKAEYWARMQELRAERDGNDAA